MGEDGRVLDDPPAKTWKWMRLTVFLNGGQRDGWVDIYVFWMDTCGGLCCGYVDMSKKSWLTIDFG